MNRIETAADALQRAHGYEYVLRTLSEHYGCTVNGEQVADVELADKLHSNLASVNLEIHSAEVTFKYLSLKVGHASDRICLNLSLGVLHHHHAVLVVGVGYGESCLWQTVEEGLLSVAVVLETLVIVEMVACKVGEYTACEVESAYALLCYCVRAALHEGILASCINHTAEQRVDLDRVGGGVVGRNLLFLDIVAHRRQQSALVAKLAEHVVE